MWITLNASTHEGNIGIKNATKRSLACRFRRGVYVYQLNQVSGCNYRRSSERREQTTAQTLFNRLCGTWNRIPAHFPLRPKLPICGICTLLEWLPISSENPALGFDIKLPAASLMPPREHILTTAPGRIYCLPEISLMAVSIWPILFEITAFFKSQYDSGIYAVRGGNPILDVILWMTGLVYIWNFITQYNLTITQTLSRWRAYLNS